MLDHIGIFVPKPRFQEVVAWYLAALAPLGYSKFKEIDDIAVGLGQEKYSVPFWIGASEEETGRGIHLALRCSDRATVDKFYEEGVKAGGKSNGAPGLRHQYHAKYYAAFVLDPVGNNIEVVDHGPSNIGGKGGV